MGFGFSSLLQEPPPHREDRLPQAKVESFIAFALPRLRKALKPIGGRG
jgi:hypothetical protein